MPLLPQRLLLEITADEGAIIDEYVAKEYRGS